MDGESWNNYGREIKKEGLEYGMREEKLKWLKEF